MTGNSVNGSRNGERSGAQTLVLLATPLNVFILKALAEGSKQQSDLRRLIDVPAQSTLRAQLKRLAEIGAIEKHRRSRFPGVLEYELTPVGGDLLFVAATLESWLKAAPGAPMSVGSNAAKAAIKALAASWSTTILRALSATPLSLTELDRIVGSLSYPALERRLGAMRLAGQIEACANSGRGTPYAVTDWLRRGAAPLAAAVSWERRHRPRTSPKLAAIDVEAVFLLAAPLLRLPDVLSGSCRLAMEISNGRNASRLAGVIADAHQGRIATCTTQIQAGADAWALGSPAAWLNAIVEGESRRLELGGDSHLARAVLESMHTALFGSAVAIRTETLT